MRGYLKRTILSASVQTVRIMQTGRNIVYQYSDETLSDEFEVDLTGELHFTIGEIIVRERRHWKISSITIEEPIDNIHRPTVWVELVYASVN